jgi:hypothetical protein
MLGAVAFQRFQPIRRRHAQIFQEHGCRELIELGEGALLIVVRKAARALAAGDLGGFGAAKALDHAAQCRQFVYICQSGTLRASPPLQPSHALRLANGAVCPAVLRDALNKLSLRAAALAHPCVCGTCTSLCGEATWHTIPHGLQAIADRSPLGQSRVFRESRHWIASRHGLRPRG